MAIGNRHADHRHALSQDFRRLTSDGRGWAILEDLFKELADYWAEHVPTGVTSTTTIGRMVLRARTRLSRVILFLVGTSHLSDYNENVFLDLTEQGLLPVTEEDIQQPEGNELASLDLLLDAANQVVVEVDQATDRRLEYAIKRVGDNRVITILPSTETAENRIVADIARQRVLYGPSENGDWKDFSMRLVAMLRQQRDALQDERQTVTEIRELLELGRYQTAFLVGVVELEGRLNRALGLDDSNIKSDAPREKFSRDLPRSLRGLLTIARQVRLITITAQEIVVLTDGRNQIVHGRELPADHLRGLAELVLRLLDELPEDGEEQDT